VDGDLAGEVFFEAKPNRTTRYVGTARAALARRGIEDFDTHVLVATSPSILTLSTVCTSRPPLIARVSIGSAASGLGGGSSRWSAPNGSISDTSSRCAA